MRELREPRSKRLLPNRYKQQHINSPDFVCFCCLTDVVYPNETFNNCRYASVLCRLPTPPWPAAESKTELSSPVPSLYCLSLQGVSVAFCSCFCPRSPSLFNPFTLSSLFCLELFTFSSSSYHLIAYFGTSGLCVA